MNNKNVLFVAVATILIGGVVFFSLSQKSPQVYQRQNQYLGASVEGSYHPVKFFDEKLFFAGILKAEERQKSFSYLLAGGIIPHDFLPSHILADFFNRLAYQEPQTIILIGPNHYEKGDFKVLSSWYGWDTPFGVVKSNQEIVRKLVNHRLASTDEEVLSNEHSVAGLMSFIKYFLPETDVVPVIVSATTTQKEVEILANNLAEIVNEKRVVLASVDFSHYLKMEEAQKNDLKTLEIIKNFEYPKLFSLGNDYLDSPASVATLLVIMQKIGKTQLEVLYHTNSGELLRDPFVQTTSYFSIAFY